MKLEKKRTKKGFLKNGQKEVSSEFKCHILIIYKQFLFSFVRPILPVITNDFTHGYFTVVHSHKHF